MIQATQPSTSVDPKLSVLRLPEVWHFSGVTLDFNRSNDDASANRLLSILALTKQNNLTFCGRASIFRSPDKQRGYGVHSPIFVYNFSIKHRNATRTKATQIAARHSIFYAFQKGFQPPFNSVPATRFDEPLIHALAPRHLPFPLDTPRALLYIAQILICRAKVLWIISDSLGSPNDRRKNRGTQLDATRLEYPIHASR